jgi:hypothetical protein
MTAQAQEPADRLAPLFTVRPPGQTVATWTVLDGQSGHDEDA